MAQLTNEQWSAMTQEQRDEMLRALVVEPVHVTKGIQYAQQMRNAKVEMLAMRNKIIAEAEANGHTVEEHMDEIVVIPKKE